MPRRRRTLLGLALALALVVVIVLATAAVVIMFPVEDEPRRADAVVVLGGLGARPVIEEAERLVDEGLADRIVVSNAFGGDQLAEHMCTAFPERYECFVPEPGTTQGEARRIEALADERGWGEVIVVTRTYHVTRARLLIGRCYSGGLTVVGVDGDLEPGDRLYQFAYQSGAFVKAAVTPGC